MMTQKMELALGRSIKTWFSMSRYLDMHETARFAHCEPCGIVRLDVLQTPQWSTSRSPAAVKLVYKR